MMAGNRVSPFCKAQDKIVSAIYAGGYLLASRV